MESLFSMTVDAEDVPAIPGLRYLADYISAQEEKDLAKEIDRLPWDNRWQRRIQPYGGGYGSATAGAPVPEWAQLLAKRMYAEGLTGAPFDHVLVNEYLAGQGIALHRDYQQYGSTVASLSLLSAYVMDFRDSAAQRKERLLLERRSLLVLSGEARSAWEHGIAHRKKDIWHGVALPRGRRLSITFRTRLDDSHTQSS